MRYYGLIGSLAIIALWFIVNLTGLVKPFFLPSPIEVAKELAELVQVSDFYFDIYSTLWRSLSGFLIGSFFGIIIGLLMGFNKGVYESMEFPIDFFRSIPATALFPLFIVIFGLGDQVKLFIAAWASSMVVLINTIYGIKGVSETKILMAKLKRISTFETYRKIIVPASLTSIFGGMRIGLSLALVVEVVAEMFLGASDGLGYRVFNASTIFEMKEVYATIIIIGLLGYLLNKSIILTEKRVVHWTGK